MITKDLKLVHVNPIFPGYFADPFVWKAEGIYFAIGTGESEASGHPVGKIFPMLQSSDFFQWHFVGGALARPDSSVGNNFWAPEIAHDNGTYYLYYSVGHGDKNHQLRVATSDMPQGPYHDVGTPLLDPKACSFAIDPHPFRDEDGHWYLFYARDFLDCSGGARSGTGLMVVRMHSMLELESEGTPVLRARSDWQRFQKHRLMYDRLWDWHTLEGPFVVSHEQRYYCFFSGGRWENETYGVDYGVADCVTGPYSDTGNESGPRVLRTLPGKVIGPGHNSIVTGPDEQTQYIVYHAWDKNMTARRMFIDKLKWTTEGPRCSGPSLG